MSTQSTAAPVRTHVVVEAPRQHAFDVFTQEMKSWWPEDHHMLDGEIGEMVFEPRAGGRVYDRGIDGRECTWARVLAYEPPGPSRRRLGGDARCRRLCQRMAEDAGGARGPDRRLTRHCARPARCLMPCRVSSAAMPDVELKPRRYTDARPHACA
jgi:hypothetical protein